MKRPLRKSLFAALFILVLLCRPLHAAIAVPQYKACAANGATVTCSFTSTPTVGDGVYVITGATGGGSTVSSIVDNQTGNTFVRVVRESDSGNGFNHDGAEIWFCASLATASGTYTLTITFSVATWNAASIIEASGLTSASVDQTGAAQDTAGANTSLTVTDGAANTNANELVLTATSAGGTAAVSTPPATGYTSVADYYPSCCGAALNGGYKIVSSLETSSASWTWTGGAYAAGVVATFKAGSSCTHYGWTSSGTWAVPNGSSGSYWLQSGAFGTPNCTSTSYYQQTTGAFGVN